MVALHVMEASTLMQVLLVQIQAPVIMRLRISAVRRNAHVVPIGILRNILPAQSVIKVHTLLVKVQLLVLLQLRVTMFRKTEVVLNPLVLQVHIKIQPDKRHVSHVEKGTPIHTPAQLSMNLQVMSLLDACIRSARDGRLIEARKA